MKFLIRKGYEDTTIRKVVDNGKGIGIVGTVDDMLKVGLFDSCTADKNKWAMLPDDSTAYFADTRDEAVKMTGTRYESE